MLLRGSSCSAHAGLPSGLPHMPFAILPPPNHPSSAPITYNATTAGGVNVTVPRREAMQRANALLDQLKEHRQRLDVRAGGGWVVSDDGTGMVGGAPGLLLLQRAR